MGADRFITTNKRDFPPTTTEIQVTYPADLPAPADGDTSTVHGMLAELVRRGGDPVREVEAALREMGYVPAVPGRRGDGPRQVYLGWADPARDYTRGKFTVSLDSRTVWLSQENDKRAVRGMPGAYTTGSYVAFRLSAPDGVVHATAAARKLKRRNP